MAESVCRALRDVGLEGEHAPALTVKDSIASPFGFDVFCHVLSQLSSSILAGNSQSRGLVVVAFRRSLSFYLELLQSKGIDVGSTNKWARILDCYTDPLGWKFRLMDGGNITEFSSESSSTAIFLVDKDNERICLKHFCMLFMLAGLITESKRRFSVAIDSVDQMLRHASMSSVAGLFSNLRSHGQISSVFWLLHSDLYEVVVTASLEYISSMVASVEPLHQLENRQRDDSENASLTEQNLKKGKFHVRFKQRSGCVQVMLEEFHIEQSGISFKSASSEGVINQDLLPKVQFSLQLSEKERIDKSNVVLPFEHQGNGKPIQIYDGRKSLMERKHETAFVSARKSETNEDYDGRCEIIYFRDSDDEMPDSDEEPDDDLDI